MALTRRLPWLGRRLLFPPPTQQRAFASSTGQPSPASIFYKTFSRPIAKTLLLAVFTYQLAYWGWAKLEADDIRAEQLANIAQLEAQVREMASKNTSLKPVSSS
ncbi:hypothetical protein L249_5458 [Ophiocordyceps polyrhachis-furcata BCC 54312]|uniref:Inner membrane assembly complex subunit 17 n=1 Tax=Ophiocordyceps polyrhachis-furcata BCC 54312 TaxID=1330021 RepID=A0A367LGY1_9HYPO|nr:hypothetical protein L249_5458 [Ophiocordyceps polyrhachis-furcata BCC 54312]